MPQEGVPDQKGIIVLGQRHEVIGHRKIELPFFRFDTLPLHVVLGGVGVEVPGNQSGRRRIFTANLAGI